MIKVGIIGGAGYTAGELIRLLLNHPGVQIEFVHSTSNAGEPLHNVHEGLVGETGMRFASEYDLEKIDLLFLCSGHGFSRTFWAEHTRPERLRVIDLAQDFRDESDGYVYGLPEVNFKRLRRAVKVANPGCFATAIQLALLPLVKRRLLSRIMINGITGSTGAGVKPGATTHFSWRTDNISVYKPFTHQHLDEIYRSLGSVNTGPKLDIIFIPMRGDFARGIFITAVVDMGYDLDEVREMYTEFYKEAPFVHISDRPIDLKQVVNTNKCVIGLDKHGHRLLITAAIDNLLKGASGQAVQNMNIMFGLDQREGLRLKPSAF